MGFGESLVKSQLIGELMTLQGIYDLEVNIVGESNPAPHKIIRVNTVNVSVSGGV